MTMRLPASILLTSLATGVVLGVLFAPASGRKTRKKIVNTKDDLHYLALKAGEIVEELREKISGLRDHASDPELHAETNHVDVA
mgnify:CR=1 FL=1